MIYAGNPIFARGQTKRASTPLPAASFLEREIILETAKLDGPLDRSKMEFHFVNSLFPSSLHPVCVCFGCRRGGEGGGGK